MYSLLIILPLISVIILNLPFRQLMKKAACWICLLVLFAQICLAVSPGLYLWAGSFDILGPFLKLDVSVDSLSRVLLFCIPLIISVALSVQRYIISDEERMFNFVNMLLIILAGMNGVVMVRDVFSLYLFLEITAVSSFILIGFNKDIDAFEAAFKYILLSVVATIFMLFSIALILLVSGDTGFSALSLAFRISPEKILLGLALGMFLCACFVKAGLMPFHGWLPDVYSAAPASVSVLLGGIVTKAVGVYTLIRIGGLIFSFNPALRYVLLTVGAFSAVVGALAALGQKDFKRMLAYSSISQVGYIILGLGCGTPLGLAGAVFHLFNHAIFKSLLFVNSAAVELEAGTTDMDKLSGLAQKMPVTGITSVLACLSCAGMPPLAGFWSKLMIMLALWAAGYQAYAVIAALAGVLTLAYFLSLQRRAFFGKPSAEMSGVKEAGPGLILPALILAAITAGVGIFFPFYRYLHLFKM